MSDGSSSVTSNERTRLVYMAAIACPFGRLLFEYDTGIIVGTILYLKQGFAFGPFCLFMVTGIVA